MLRLPTATGLAQVAIASVGFGLIGVLAALADRDGGRAIDSVAFRCLGLAPLVLVFLDGSRRARIRGSLAALLSMTALSLFGAVSYFVAIERMSPAFVSLLVYTYPALVVLGSLLLGWTRRDVLTGVGVAIVLAGVVITIGLPDDELDTLGAVLALANAMSYAVYLLLAQHILRKLDVVTTLGFVGGFSSVLLLCPLAVLGIGTGVGRTGLVYLTGLAGVFLVAHVLIMSAIDKVGSVAAALVSCLEVVTAVVLSAVVLGTTLSSKTFVGGLMILLGAVATPIVASRRAKHVNALRTR